MFFGGFRHVFKDLLGKFLHVKDTKKYKNILKSKTQYKIHLIFLKLKF